MTPANERHVLLLATGGTISARAEGADLVTYQAGQRGASELLGDVGAGLPAGLQIHTVQVAQIDSKDMHSGIWRELVRQCQQAMSREGLAGIVITHGTDTMEETAWLLHALLPARCPVVLTGAMRPANPRLSDGAQNLADALALATDPLARGVHVVFGGRVHAAGPVRKAHPYRLDAFDSGEAGPVALVEEGQVRWLAIPTAGPDADADLKAHRCAAFLAGGPVPRVEIVLNHADADGTLARAAAAAGAAGIVVAGTGNGTLSAALEQALRELQARGIVVWRTTRCAEGALVPTASEALPQSPVAHPVKARISLMLELMAGTIAR